MKVEFGENLGVFGRFLVGWSVIAVKGVSLMVKTTIKDEAMIEQKSVTFLKI